MKKKMNDWKLLKGIILVLVLLVAVPYGNTIYASNDELASEEEVINQEKDIDTKDPINEEIEIEEEGAASVITEAIDEPVSIEPSRVRSLETPSARSIVGDVATIDISRGFVEIDATGFTQARARTAHTGSYVLTGEFNYTTLITNDDAVVITGGSEAAPIKVTLDNLKINNNNPNSISSGSAIKIGGSSNGTLITGHVAMTLKGDNFLQGAYLNAGIELYGTNAPDSISTLLIDGDGTLTTTGGESGAGIGSMMQPIKEVYYRLTINSGTIIAQGGSNAAGIGGGKNSSGGEIIINGGNITSKGGISGAGIGGGVQQTLSTYYRLLTDMTVKINGGNVQAIGGNLAPGIGTGVLQFIWQEVGGTPDNLPVKKLDISITNGAVVNATGGEYASGIGHGWNSHFYYDKAPDGTTLPENPWEISNLLIENADVNAKGNEYSAGIGTSKTGVIQNLIIKNAKVYAEGGYAGPGIGSGYDKFSHVNNIEISADVTAIGGLYGAGIGTGMRSNVGTIKILGGNVKASASVIVDENGQREGSAAGIGTGYDGGKVDEVFIGKDATVEATAGMFSAGIGRGFYKNVVVDEFPITIENGANVTAYAIGDVYASLLKVNPSDESEATPDGLYLTAIDQGCMAHPLSKFEANILMGDFKEIPNENAEQEVTINQVKNRVNNKVSLPTGYASFATTVSDGAVRVRMNGATYAGNVEKRKEDNLIISMGGNTEKLYDYWMLQPKMVEYKVDYQFTSTENPTAITVPDSVTVEENKTITMPNFTAPENWIFDGWYTDEQCTQKYDFNTAVDADFILYGKWAYKTETPELPNTGKPDTPNSGSKSPNTGDTTQVGLAIMFLLLSAVTITILIIKKRTNTIQNNN